MKTLLVTGHLGFIGSGFCALYAKDYRIVGVDYAGAGSMPENLAPNVEDVRADIGDEPAMTALIDRVQPHAIVNFAAESHVDRSIGGDLQFWKSNVLGARVLALAALRNKIRMLHVSTDEVYGDARDAAQAWREESPMLPINPYAVTKAAAEHLLRSYAHTHGLDVVITRGANTIGPRQFPEKAVPKAVMSFTSGAPFPLFRSPARRMWMYVDDHARGIHLALTKGRAGETYNLPPAADNEAFTHDVIERVKQQVGRGEIRLVEDRKAYDLRYWMNGDKALAELGFVPEFDLGKTIARTVNWYLENPRWLAAALAASAVAARSP